MAMPHLSDQMEWQPEAVARTVNDPERRKARVHESEANWTHGGGESGRLILDMPRQYARTTGQNSGLALGN